VHVPAPRDASHPGCKRTLAALLTTSAIVTLACGPAPQVNAEPIDRDGGDRSVRQRAEGERLWVERADEAKLRAALAAYRRAVKADDDDVTSYTMAAHASYLLGDGFLAPDGRHEETKRAFADGVALAERGLRALSRDFEARRQDGNEVDDAAIDLGPEAAPLLYWWAQNAIRWADADGPSASMRIYRRVFRVMEQVRRLEPTLDDGGPDRFFGAARAESPRVAGGDLTRSHEHFQRTLAIHPGRLETHLQLARHYARRANDAGLYQRAMRTVLQTPAATPEDEITKKKARSLPRSLRDWAL
jgi:hypothetical protein